MALYMLHQVCRCHFNEDMTETPALVNYEFSMHPNTSFFKVKASIHMVWCNMHKILPVSIQVYKIKYKFIK